MVWHGMEVRRTGAADAESVMDMGQRMESHDRRHLCGYYTDLDAFARRRFACVG